MAKLQSITPGSDLQPGSPDFRTFFSGGLLRLGDDRLHLRGGPAADLDLDHEGPGLADRLLEADLLPVHLEPAGGWIASAISAEVTEPKSLPSSPARWLIVRTVFPSRRGGLVGALGRLLLGGRGALASPPGLLAEEASAGCASFRGTR